MLPPASPARKKYLFLIFVFAVAVFLLWPFFSPFKSAQRQLIVFTYSSFMSSYGPGPELARRFEETCGCKVAFLDVGDAGLLLQRLKLVSAAEVDVILGLDQFFIDDAERDFDWRPLSIQPEPLVTAVRNELKESFVPYDWAPMTLVVRKGQVPKPQSLDDLLTEGYSSTLALQDPRSSTPGMQWLFWLFAVKGEGLESYLGDLKKSSPSISTSWSEAYALFKRGQAKSVFSYFTSPLYHQIEEQDGSYAALAFRHPHPYQIEYVGVPKFCRECDLAEDFVAFLLTPAAQKIIMTKNYMLPVVEGVAAGTPFAAVPKVELIPAAKLRDFNRRQDEILQIWQKIMGGM